MKLYDNRNNKSSITCGYCNHEGHNKRNCPTLRRHWEANKDWNPRTMMMSALKDVNGADFGGWFRMSDIDARRCFNRHFQYINDIMTSPKTTPKKRRASRCGFCGSKRHTRRNCSLMGKFVKILEETNMAYREKFYEEVFVKTGLGIGAFVELLQYTYSTCIGRQQATSIITDIDFDSISIGNRFNRWSDWATTLIVKVIIGDRERSIGEDLFLTTSFPLLDRVKTQHLTNNYEGITKVIVPAPSIPDKEWFLGQSPAFDWVVKKKNLATLFQAYRGLISLYHPEGEAIIEKWRKKV